MQPKTLPKNDMLWLAMCVSFFAVGLPFWFIPYHQLNLPSALLHPSLLVVVLSSALLCAFKRCAFWKTIWMMTLAVVAAELARVMVDVALDSTTHNLLPFEIIITFLVGFPCALTGAIAGWSFAQLLPHFQGNHNP